MTGVSHETAIDGVSIITTVTGTGYDVAILSLRRLVGKIRLD